MSLDTDNIFGPRERNLIELHRKYLIFENKMKYHFENVKNAVSSLSMQRSRAEQELANNLAVFMHQFAKQVYMMNMEFTSVEVISCTLDKLKAIFESIVLIEKNQIAELRTLRLEEILEKAKSSKLAGNFIIISNIEMQSGH